MGRPTVLVVDDDQGIRALLQTALEGQGCKVLAAKSGEEALRLLRTGGVQLAILDVLLPRGNGFEVVSQLRQNAWGREIPVVMISGVYRSRHHRDTMSKRYQVVEYLDKPLDLEVLLGVVAERLGLESQPGAAVRRPRPPVDEAPGQPPPGTPHRVLTDPQRPRRAPAAVEATFQAEQAEVEGDAGFKLPVGELIYEGTFVQKPFPFVIGHIVKHQLDGALLVQHEQVKKIVYFKGGAPVAIKSNLVSECLGKLLVQERLVSQEECDRSFEQMKASGKRQGEILVEMGSLTAGNLEFALMLQIETKLFDIFAWEEGAYRLNPSAPIPAAEAQLEWTGLGLIHEGITRAYDEHRLRKVFKPLIGMPVSLDPTAPELAQLTLAPNVALALAGAKATPIARLARELPVSGVEALQLIYTLLATEVLTPAEGPGGDA